MADTAGTNSIHLEEESRVTTLELFFDLVFVFTLTQLTAVLARSLTWESLFQYLLVLVESKRSPATQHV